MALQLRGGVWLSRAEPAAAAPLSSHAGILQAMASGEMRFAAGSNVRVYSAASNVLLGAGGVSNVVTVQSNLVVINGDVHIRGNIEAYTSTRVHFQDKVLQLATPCNDDATRLEPEELDGCGLLLAPVSSARGEQVYERSLRWRAGGGGGAAADEAAGAGAAAAQAAPPPFAAHPSNAAYWELAGGGLRISAPRGSNGARVSYGMHINARHELEMYKYMLDEGGAEHYQRVYTFGGTPAPLAMPASAPRAYL